MRALCCILVLGVGLLAPSVGAEAAGRAPSEYFKLDLQQALMSGEPLGPPAHFERYGIQANSGGNWLPAPRPPTQSAAAPQPSAPAPDAAAAPAPRHQLTQRHLAPRDARAAMSKPKPRTPITRWPCRSGGICAWQSGPAR